MRGSADDGKVEFTLFSFDSPQAASAVAKGMAARKRDGGGTALEPVRIEAGADDTDAFSSGRLTDVVMRVGGVVAYVRAVETETGNVNHAATHQADRIKNVA
ncbi:hypothetical protein ACLGIH_32590 [Streptomyces sp. HMX87]|uniref:hypothetical protein n=1 Tax=Streptomyces sp. HMX87 TaxID=3390849 RepID=UPI003A89AC5E